MKSLIVQTVRVGPGGRVEVTDPELPEGSEAEVTVRVSKPTTPTERMAAFRALQASMKLTKEQGDRWAAQVRAEREAGNRPAR